MPTDHSPLSLSEAIINHDTKKCIPARVGALELIYGKTRLSHKKYVFLSSVSSTPSIVRPGVISAIPAASCFDSPTLTSPKLSNIDMPPGLGPFSELFRSSPLDFFRRCRLNYMCFRSGLLPEEVTELINIADFTNQSRSTMCIHMSACTYTYPAHRCTCL